MPNSGGNSNKASSSSAMARQSSGASRASSTFSQDQQMSPEIFPLDDPFGNMTMSDQCIQFMSPPTHGYSAQGQTTDYFTNEFGYQNLHTIPQIYTEQQIQQDFSQSLPPTLPPMYETNMYKQEPYVVDDDYLNPFGISYATLASMDFKQQMPAGYQHRVNHPLSSLRQFPHSR